MWWWWWGRGPQPSGLCIWRVVKFMARAGDGGRVHPSAFLPLVEVLSRGGLAWPGRPRCQVGAAARLTRGKPAALLSAGAGAGRGHGLKRGNAGGRPCALLLTASFWMVEVVTVWGWLAEPQVSGSVVPFVLRKARGGLPGAISEPPPPRPPPVSCLLRGPGPPSFPSLLCQVEGSPSHLCL